MLVRIVKMTFQPDKVEEFMAVFNASKDKIRGFEGCRYMELLSDRAKPNVLFTRSIWEGEEALEKYRHSALFQATWAKTKVLFAERPEAYSLKLRDVPGDL